MPDRIASLYQRHAHAFDAARRRSFPERPWLERFARALPVGASILDLGCGGGEPIARFLCDRGFHLTGVDITPSMIQLARTRFFRHRWFEGDMRSFEAGAATFDGVIAWSSLFHLDATAQQRMIPRIAAWLKPRGIAMFNAGPERGVRIGEFEGEPLYHASLSPAEYRAAFASCGLAELAYRAEDPECGGVTVWLVARL